MLLVRRHLVRQVAAVFFCTFPEGGKMESKLYVGNLSYQTTEDELRALFAQAGTVEAVDLIKDRDTGTSKGFAFVTMSSSSEAESAIQMFNGRSLGNRELRVNVARPREERAPGSFGGGRGQGGYRSGGGGNRDRDRRGGNRRY
jgi:RNA recognition motif-containing protein